MGRSNPVSNCNCALSGFYLTALLSQEGNPVEAG